jgi:Mg2+/Co2+ transporter CorB
LEGCDILNFEDLMTRSIVQFPLVILTLALLFLIGLSAFFSAAEIGMMSLNRYRLRYLVKTQNKQAILVNKLLTSPDRLLGCILIGNTLATILASMVATLIGQHYYEDIGVAVATVLLSFVFIIFAEMIPKTLGAIHSQAVAFKTAFPLQCIQLLLSPLVKVIGWVTQVVLRLFGVSLSSMQKEILSREELRSVVSEAGGFLPIEHKSMVLSLLDLERARVEDILVPKSEIVGIDLNQPWQEILEEFESTEHTRIPLYRDTIDDLVGLVHLRDVLKLALKKELNMETLLEIAKPPYFIPEAMPLNVQIVNFQKMKRRSCFVVNEYGDLQGLVAMEDILEEIVGEFTTDIASLSRDIMPQEDGWLVVDASITLRQFNRLTGWQLPSIGPRTLSGLIIEYLGYIPPVHCCLMIENYQIEILKISHHRIRNVKMQLVKRKK